jgi:serine/threonine protein kinase
MRALNELHRASANVMLSPDTILQNRYHVVRQLGQGGMGTVYEAIDRRLDATVALKETLFKDDNLRMQFEREARLLARLHHPALPKVSDHFVEGDGQFLVMQFIEGVDLDAMRKRSGGQLTPGDVLKWADQLLDTLDYLHSQDPPVIHRDIKPQNLKLTARGQIILLDFGLAKGSTGTTNNITLVKSFFGFTPMYAPLEQIRGTGTDPRSDLYSLGATLYHLLTGVAPPDALTRVTATTDGDDDPLLPASELTEQISPAVSNVLNKAMAISRNKRFASAEEMRETLGEAVRAPITFDNVRASNALATTVTELPPAGPPTTRGQWNEYSFFEEAGKHLNQTELESLRRLYDFSSEYARVTWGTGTGKGTFNVKFDDINSKSLYSVATNGDLYLNFAWVVDTQVGLEIVDRLAPRLKQLRGFNIPSNYREKYVTVPRSQWVAQVGEFIGIINDIILSRSNSQVPTQSDEQTAIANPEKRSPNVSQDEEDDASHVTSLSPPVEEDTLVSSSQIKAIEFIGNDESYMRWLGEHPGGYVINSHRSINPSYMVLHKAACGMIKSTQGIPPGGFTERNYIKIYGGSIESLRKWVKQHGRPDGSFSSACNICRPTGEHTIPITRHSNKNVAGIDESVVVININQQFPYVRNADDLYNCTRSMWRIDRARASRARYAFSVYQGEIKEVYTVDRWMPATDETIRYWQGRNKEQGKYFPPEVDHGRSEFVGKIAPEHIRKKYVGKQMPKRHSQNPILYFNC